MNFEKVRKQKRNYRVVTAAGNTLQEAFPVFYIGDRTAVLDNVSEKLGAENFSVVNFSQARAYLRQLFEENQQLGAILIDLPVDKEEFRKFSRFILGSDYAAVPLILLSSKITIAERAFLADDMLVDDVIHPVRDMFTIRERVRFVRKVKEELITLRRPRRLRRGYGDVLKRTMDVFLSFILLLLLAPVLLLTALVIRLDSTGPVFYNCYRVGKGYRVFKMFRFRTMKVGADRLVTSLSHINRFGKDGTFQWKDRDPRVTRVGGFLRATGLDMLPQLYNVLRGDMSIVGNKPLPLYEAASFTTNEHASRFEVPAGMTGLWQTSRASASGPVLSQDLAYARHHGFWIDLRIMLKACLQRIGRRRRQGNR